MTQAVEPTMKLNMKLTLVALLLVITSIVRSQVSYNSFNQETDLNIKSEMGLELWNHYIRFNLDSLKIAAVDLLLLASEHEHEFGRAVGTRMLGSYLYRSGKIDQGLEYLAIAKKFFEQKEDYMIASEVYNEVGNALQLKGDFEKSKDAYRKSLRFGEQSPDPTAAFNGKLGLGKVYIALGDTNLGMSLIHSYKQLALQNQKYEAASDAFAYLAMIESARKNESLAQEYYLKSIDNSKKSESKVHLAHSFANLGILKFGLEEFDSSHYYFRESLRLREEMSAKRPIVESHYNLGFFYMERDSMDQAIQEFTISAELAERYNLIQDEIDALTELQSIYKGQTKDDLADQCEVRIKELEKKKLEMASAEEKELRELDLNFTKENAKKEKSEGLSWVTFTIIVLALAVLLFFFLERKHFS